MKIKIWKKLIKDAVRCFNALPSSWGEASHINAMMESREQVRRQRLKRKLLNIKEM